MWLNYSCIKSFSWLEPLPAVYIIQWAALVSWTIWATTLAFTFYSPCYCYRFFWTSYISLLLYCSLLIDCRIVALLHWLCSQRCTCEWIWKTTLSFSEVMWLNVVSNHFDHPWMCSMRLDCSRQAFHCFRQRLEDLNCCGFPVPLGLDKLSISTHSTV